MPLPSLCWTTQQPLMCRVIAIFPSLLPKVAPIIEASLSEPHTMKTALQDACVYVCLFAYGVAIYTKILSWTNGNKFKVHVHFKFVHPAKAPQNSWCKLTRWTPHYLTPHRQIYWMRQRTPHHVIQRWWIYWVQEQQNRLRLGRPGMMLKNRTDSSCSIVEFSFRFSSHSKGFCSELLFFFM